MKLVVFLMIGAWVGLSYGSDEAWEQKCDTALLTASATIKEAISELDREKQKRLNEVQRIEQRRQQLQERLATLEVEGSKPNVPTTGSIKVLGMSVNEAPFGKRALKAFSALGI